MNSTPSPDEQLRQTQKPTCNTYVGTAICPGGRPIPAQQAGGICSCVMTSRVSPGVIACSNGMRRTDAYPGEVLVSTELADDAAHAVVAAVAALGPQPHFRGRQIQVIVHHEQPTDWHLHADSMHIAVRMDVHRQS